MITDAESGKPLSFAVLRVFSSSVEQEIRHVVADHLGRYYCLVSPGSYYVTIEEKNRDGSYSKVFQSEEIKAEKGIIRRVFKV
jgi:hypothetical protein